MFLDDAPALSWGGRPVVTHSAALADALAEEWRSQGSRVEKSTMPLMQFASVALDLAGPKRDEVLADILPYGETDLLCYRAGDTEELTQKQAQLLDPIIAWAESKYGVSLHITTGLMPVAQPQENRAKLANAIAHYDAWKLAALAGAVRPLGSFYLALALAEGHIDAGTAFGLSQLEEAYETDKWGNDEEKEMRLARLKNEISQIGKFLSLLMSSVN